MEKNNFKLLEDDPIEDPDALHKLKMRVDGSFGFMTYWGDIVELYLGKISEFVVSYFGGDKED